MVSPPMPPTSTTTTPATAPRKRRWATSLDTTLADNGGPTVTHALRARQPGHRLRHDGLLRRCAGQRPRPARRAAQRRLPGTGNDGAANLCDAGAFEVQLPPTATLTIAKATTPAGGQDFPFTVDPGAYDFDFGWGTEGTSNGQFIFPNDVAVDTAGNVYVADTNNDRIQKFDSSGSYLGQWGSFGSGDGAVLSAGRRGRRRRRQRLCRRHPVTTASRSSTAAGPSGQVGPTGRRQRQRRRTVRLPDRRGRRRRRQRLCRRHPVTTASRSSTAAAPI